MKTYNEFKPQLKEVHRAGSFPSIRRNIIGFIIVITLLVIVILSAIFFTSYKKSLLVDEYNSISVITNQNNDVITKNLDEMASLIKAYPDDFQKDLSAQIQLKIKPVDVLTPEKAIAINEDKKVEYEQAIELIENSPFRFIDDIEKEIDKSSLVGSKLASSSEYQAYKEALQKEAPIRYENDVLIAYLPQAKAKLKDSYIQADLSDYTLLEVKEASGYMLGFNEMIEKIKNRMTVIGLTEEQQDQTITSFTEATPPETFLPTIKSEKGSNIGNMGREVMSENYKRTEINFKKVNDYLDTLKPKEPEPVPKVEEVKAVEVPKVEEVKAIEIPKVEEKPKAEAPKPTPKPTPKPKPRQQAVPTW